MYLCLNCEILFEDPKHYIETHGFDSPPYETWDGCPECGGGYVETMECYECGEYITGEYIELNNGAVICDGCYERNNIADWQNKS